MSPWRSKAFGPGREATRSIEYVCTSCGRNVRAEGDVVEERRDRRRMAVLSRVENHSWGGPAVITERGVARIWTQAR
jgi:hypothetical protein